VASGDVSAAAVVAAGAVVVDIIIGAASVGSDVGERLTVGAAILAIGITPQAARNVLSAKIHASSLWEIMLFS